MPLTLVKEIQTFSLTELETNLENARVQRLMLRIKFKEAYDLKLSVISVRIKAKLAKQLQIFAKDLVALDKCFERCDARVESINITRNEVSYVQDAIDEE